MTQTRLPISRGAALTVAVAAMGCATLADGNEPVLALQAMSSPGSASTQTITLVSAPAGLAEGAVLDKPSIVAINGAALPRPTPSIVTHTETWASAFPGASYVSSCPDCGSVSSRCDSEYAVKSPSSISFVDTFDLPLGFSNPVFAMTTTADDVADVYLNGIHIGRVQTCCSSYPGQLITTLRSEDPSVFRVGKNELRYDLSNLNTPCPISMAYVATVTIQAGDAGP